MTQNIDSRSKNLQLSKKRARKIILTFNFVHYVICHICDKIAYKVKK